MINSLYQLSNKGSLDVYKRQGLTLDKFDSVVPVNLLIKGKKADKIVMKNCDVDAKATAKANQ